MMLKRKALKYGILSVLAVAGVYLAVINSGVQEARMEEVKMGVVRDLIEVRGRVELAQKETIYSQVSGIVQQVLEAGEAVDEGARILALDDRDFSFTLSKAQAQLEQLEAAAGSAREDYENKKVRWDKNQVLQQAGALSQQELKDTESLMKAAEYACKSADAAQRQARLAIDELTTNIRRTSSVVTGGVVLARHVEKGARVDPGTPLLEVGNLASAYIMVNVLSDDAAKIKVGQKALISGKVLELRELEGEVYYMAPQAKSSVSSLGVEQQRVEVRIRYDNSAANLKPGYEVDVDIVAGEKAEVLYVLDKAVFEDNGQDLVFVVQGGKIKLRPVLTGLESEDYIEIREGLTLGETVVIDPAKELREGIRVKQR